jgi:hypothetical protein
MTYRTEKERQPKYKSCGPFRAKEAQTAQVTKRWLLFILRRDRNIQQVPSHDVRS